MAAASFCLHGVIATYWLGVPLPRLTCGFVSHCVGVKQQNTGGFFVVCLEAAERLEARKLSQVPHPPVTLLLYVLLRVSQLAWLLIIAVMEKQ